MSEKFVAIHVDGEEPALVGDFSEGLTCGRPNTCAQGGKCGERIAEALTDELLDEFERRWATFAWGRLDATIEGFPSAEELEAVRRADLRVALQPIIEAIREDMS